MGPSKISTCGFLVPKKNLAASSALVSKYGKMVFTSFFRLAYCSASVTGSMAKNTWNFGLAGLPFFTFMWLRL